MHHDYYHVQEWTPRLRQVAEEIMAKIRQVAPELEILFMGAAALELPGKNDLDLDILCSQDELGKYTAVLVPILGTPQEQKDTMTIWSGMYDGVEIDCILSDPATPGSHVPEQRKVFEILRSSPELHARYRQLKYQWDGLLYDQYEANKKAFLKEVENHSAA